MIARMNSRRHLKNISGIHSSHHQPKTPIMEIEKICSMPLPSNLANCAHEIEILGDRQRAVVKRLHVLIDQLDVESSDNTSLGILEDLPNTKMVNQPSGNSVRNNSPNANITNLPIVHSEKGKSNNVKQHGITIYDLKGSSVAHKQHERSCVPSGIDMQRYSRTSTLSRRFSKSLKVNKVPASENSSPLMIALKRLQDNQAQKKTIKK